MLPQTSFALIRHGETDWNRRNLIQGATDVPLNEIGLLQAQGAGETLLASHSIRPWQAVVTSPLSRARDTGSRIAEILDIQLLEAVPEFTERYFGQAEGWDLGRARELYPDGDYPNSEELELVYGRSLAALDNLSSTYSGKRLIVVTHGGLLHVLLSRIAERRLPSIENGSVNIIDRVNGTWRVSQVNGSPIDSHVST